MVAQTTWHHPNTACSPPGLDTTRRAVEAEALAAEFPLGALALWVVVT